MKQDTISDSMLNEVRKFLNFLDSLSDEDKKNLVNGERIVLFSISKSSNIEKTKARNLEDSEIELIILHLKEFDNREEADSYLGNKQLSRDNYKVLIKALDLPYNKKDNITQMRAKIIEGTVGFRLRSEAIHSEPLF